MPRPPMHGHHVEEFFKSVSNGFGQFLSNLGFQQPAPLQPPAVGQLTSSPLAKAFPSISSFGSLSSIGSLPSPTAPGSEFDSSLPSEASFGSLVSQDSTASNLDLLPTLMAELPRGRRQIRGSDEAP